MSQLSLEGVRKRYREVVALRGICLRIPSGACVRVVGPNGAGKSTLLRVAAGLTRPTDGHVRLGTTDLFGPGRAGTRTRIGYLGQETGLYAELGVRENLELGARLHGLPPTRVGELLRELDLERVEGRALRALSTGFRRRAALARALLTEPSLLLLDEPWNGLDAAASELLTERLTLAHRGGATLLVAAHGADAPGLFDGELGLAEGRLAEARGSVAESRA